MFRCRGRGKPVQVLPYLSTIYPIKPGPICIGKRKTLSINNFTSKGRAGIKFAKVFVEEKLEQDAEIICDQNGNILNRSRVEPVFAPLSQVLLIKGVFTSPSGALKSLNSMPDRVLNEIFSYINDAKTLTACEYVCRRWMSLLALSKMHKANLQKQVVKKMNFEITKNVSTLTCDFKKSRLPNSGKQGDCDYYSMIWRIPAVYARNSYVGEIVSKVLKRFDVWGLGFVDMTISVDLLNLVVTLQSCIKQLKFLRCLIDGNALASLKAIRGMKELAIDHCFGFGDAISTNSIVPILKSNIFRSFELCGANVLKKVDDEVMEALIKNWKYERFDFMKLTNCPRITTEAIAKVANHYERLQKSGKLVMFLKNTGFDVDQFLSTETAFQKKDTPTKLRIRLESETVLIWVEK